MKNIKISDNHRETDGITYYQKDGHFLVYFPKEEYKQAKEKLSEQFNKAGIYIFFDLENGYRYIGQTINIDSRIYKDGQWHPRWGEDFTHVLVFGIENGDLDPGQLDKLEREFIQEDWKYETENKTKGNSSSLALSSSIDADNLRADIDEILEISGLDLFNNEPRNIENETGRETTEEQNVKGQIYEVSDGGIAGKSGRSRRSAYVDYVYNLLFRKPEELKDIIYDGPASFREILAKYPPQNPNVIFSKTSNIYFYKNLSSQQMIKKVTELTEKIGKTLIETERQN